MRRPKRKIRTADALPRPLTKEEFGEASLKAIDEHNVSQFAGDAVQALAPAPPRGPSLFARLSAARDARNALSPLTTQAIQEAEERRALRRQQVEQDVNTIMDSVLQDAADCSECSGKGFFIPGRPMFNRYFAAPCRRCDLGKIAQFMLFQKRDLERERNDG